MSSTADYFALFSLSPSFLLSEPLLEQAYFTLQRQWHPDRFAGKSAEERAQAMQMSLTINESYATLRDPLKRAQYLLQLQGIRVNTAQDNVTPLPATLMEVMELQEALDDSKDITAFAAGIGASIAACKETLSQLFDAEDYAAAAQTTLRLQYLTKIAEAARLKAFAEAGA